MQADTAGWAALVPWTGIQNPPSSVTAIANVVPLSGVVTITTAKLTPAGTNGSQTFQNGVLIRQTPAT